MQDTPLVSISCITYNHEKYIRDAIEGFLMQKTSFTIEILIHDDASTDRTADIIKEYEKKHPDLIFPIYQKENQYSKGIIISPTYNWSRARGKYIALCEGDDYWTDPYKLQKQVDFLEENPEYVLTGHDAKIIDENGVTIKESKLPNGNKKDFNKEILKKGVWLLTLTLCFRNVTEMLPLNEFNDSINGDVLLTSFLGNFGHYKYIPQIIPAAYRQHETGIWSARNNLSKLKSQLKTRKKLRDYYYKKKDRITWKHFNKQVAWNSLEIFKYYIKNGQIKNSFNTYYQLWDPLFLLNPKLLFILNIQIMKTFIIELLTNKRKN